MDYIERMKKIGELRNTVIELINWYNKELKSNLTYYNGEKYFDIFNNEGLVSKLKFGLIPTIQINKEDYLLNNELKLIGFYQIK